MVVTVVVTGQIGSVERTCTLAVDRGNNGRNRNLCIAFREHSRGLTEEPVSAS